MKVMLYIAGAMFLTSGCVLLDPLPLLYDIIVESNPPPDPEAWSGLSFRDTELYGLFSKYPYDTNTPFEQQFPRVALTVLNTPPNHSEPPSELNKVCWRLRAKIWFTPYSSRYVAPFHWCSPRDIARGIPLSGADSWFFVPGSDSTGNRRTEGPVPPQFVVPTDLKHQKFWHPSPFNTNTMDGIMFVSLLYYMGFDWTNKEDHRVWIVEFVQARW